MRILHTSDWHIGRRLKEKDRSEEFKEFFAWLIEKINNEKIDVLLVAGDIFDNINPSIMAQNIYYSFLNELANSSCRHCVIISGNHDSPAFLDAPSDLLKNLNIHVIGRASQDPDDEIIFLQDPDLIICAVPYLRDRDVRNANDEVNSIDEALKKGICEHYEKVFTRARELKADSNIPVIAMGHLFTKGGTIKKDDGTRSLYVGTAIEIPSELFSDEIINYTALGHLHSPQFIGRENIRYSGSPIARGFGEAGTRKAVFVIEFDENNNPDIKEIFIPEFQKLEQLSGNLDEIFRAIEKLSRKNESIWLDITYTGDEIVGDLNERINDFVKSYPLLEVLAVHYEGVNESSDIVMINEDINDISPVKMLEMCFEANKINEEQQEIFMPLYKEILSELEIDE